jgi:hypothetical protein
MDTSEDTTYWLARTGERDAEGNYPPDDVRRDAERIGVGIERRIRLYAERMIDSGRVDIWFRTSRLYFSRDSDSGLKATSVQVGGRQGELIGTRGNLLGRYHRAVSVLVTGSRPSYSASSIDSSAEAISQVAISNALLAFVIAKRNAEAALRRAEAFMQLYGQSWVGVTWDERGGRPVGRDALGRMRYEGEIRIEAKRPDEVVYDVDLDENTPNEWVIVARQFSRWSLIGRYPQYRDHILNGTTRTLLEDIRDQLRLDGMRMGARGVGDTVTGYELHSPPSAINPEGCYALWLDGKVIALDRALYDDLAHYEMVAEVEPGTRNGHSFLWDLCGPQQVSDSVLSTILTVVTNYGNPVLYEPMDAVMNTSKDAAMNPFSSVKATSAPSFVSLDPSILSPLVQARDQIEQLMTGITGLNDAALGDAGKSQSGEALATMHSLALQSVSSAQASYAECFGAVMYGSLLRYRAFASVEKIVGIAGKTYSVDATRFKNSPISGIDGVDVEMGAASMRHAAGRKEYADKLFAAGVVTPEQYLEVQATGKMEPILDRPRTQRGLIEAENERLRAGQMVAVSPYDDHRMHIAQQSIVLDDIDVRTPNPDGSPNVVFVVTDTHLAGHLAALKAMDPDLASALAQEALPSRLMPPAPAADPNAAQTPNMAGPVATGAAGGLPPTGNDGADVAATDMPIA